jgi:uncharacterized repeat protein (TIGR01451 family)
MAALSAQEFVWVKNMRNPTNTSQAGNAVCQDALGNVYVAGFYNGDTDFDPGPGVFTLPVTGLGGSDIFILKLDVSGKLVWVKQIGAPQFNVFISLCIDPLGNLVLAGGYRGTGDFDPGPGVFSLPYAGNNRDDIFIVKLDGNGGFMWAGAAQGPNSDDVQDLFVDHEGFIYLTGTFDGAIDLNPATGQQPYSLAVSGIDCFVSKLDPDGKLVWGKTFGSLNTDGGVALAVDLQGNVYSTGTFGGYIDIDPGTPVVTLLGTFNTIYVQKLDKNGNFVWGKATDGSGNDAPWELALDPDGNVYTAGWVSGTADLDPGPQQQTVTTPGSSNTYVQKLSPAGDLLWAFMETSDRAINIVTNGLGQTYIFGIFSGTVDFDPGPGVFNLTESGTPPIWLGDSYVQILNPDGSFVRAYKTPVNYTNVHLDPQGNLVATGGFTGTIDFDPGPGIKTLSSQSTVQSDIFVLKMSENPFWDFNGTVFHDLNSNLLQDAGEPGLYGVLVKDRQQDRYVSTDSFGRYHFFDDVSGDTIALASPRAYWTVVPEFAIPVTPQAEKNFSVSIPANATDLCISMVANPPFRPGFETDILLQVANVGIVPVDSAQVRLRMVTQPVPDPLEFISAQPLPDFLSNELYTWDMFNLVPGETRDVRIRFRTPANAVLGSPVVLSAGVPLDDDIYPNNNGTRVKTTVVGSFDPNDKTVSPERATPTGLDTTVLQYVVRFQNTGTFPAEFVIIRDTLPAALNLSSLQMLAASHPFTWRLFENRLLEVRFDHIQLPDSTSNEPESHGFVSFSVKAPKGLPLGAQVQNRAGIYFDYNAPVITNYAVFTVSNVVAAQAPADPLNFDLAPNPAAANSPVWLLLPASTPLPAQLRLTDVSGKALLMQELTTRNPVLTALPTGTYQVQVLANGKSGVKTLIVR